MKFTFPALKKSHPKNFEASRRKTTAIATVTHRPYIMPLITRLKSLAPRTSPYRVAPQFGHRIQKHRNGMRSRLLPRNGEKLIFGGMDPAAALMVAVYVSPLVPKSLADSELNELWNPARDPNSIASMTTASAATPR